MFVSAVVGEQSRIHVTDTAADPLVSFKRSSNTCMPAVWLAKFKSCPSASPRGNYHLFIERALPIQITQCSRNGTFQALGAQVRGARGERVLIGGNAKRT